MKILAFLLLYFASNTHCTSNKISADLTKRLEKDGNLNVLVTFDGTDDICKLPGARARSPLSADRSTALSTLKSQLETKMASSQAGVLYLLSKQKSAPKFTQFWILNSIRIENADAALLQSISEDPKVTSIEPEPQIQDIKWKDAAKSESPKPNGEPQPNLKFIGVPEAWEILGGKMGDGIRVGLMDSGVRHTHEALKDSWLGKYGWCDPAGGSPEPVDTGDHGTLVVGFITGALGLGVAPNAKWMACRRAEYSFPAIVGCAQWFVCPTLPDGSETDCSKAPHIINNSWGYDYGLVTNGTSDYWMNKTVMDSMIECWHAAGIIPVFSNGNDGPRCSTGKYPNDSPRVISVGATDMNGQIVYYSSRGPANERAGGGLKPDLSAPSENVLGLSSKGDDKYEMVQHGGTSSAAPHIAGTIALLLNKHDEKLNFDQVKTMLQESATKVLQTGSYDNCGDVTIDQFPNSLVGHGVVNLVSLLNMEIPAL